MKNKYKTLITIIAVICCNQLFAQHGHSPNHNMTTMIRPTLTRPQPRATGNFNAMANANVNAKIHANSNSVFGTGNTSSSTQIKKEDERDNRKEDKEENKNNSKKHK